MKNVIPLLLLLASFGTLSAQVTLRGKVLDGGNKTPITYVNIGLRDKNIGAISLKDGSFSIHIPAANTNDTLVFSMAGYADLALPVSDIIASQQKIFLLKPAPNILAGVIVHARRVEKAFGLTKSKALVHFTDASTNQGDIFEIAQLVELDTVLTRITSVNLLIAAPRKDSGIFRINFYSFDSSRPGQRIAEKEIIQTKKIEPGFLKFDLNGYNIYLRGRFIVAIEFLPSPDTTAKPIQYEVKLGGGTRSFVRSHSLGKWVVPPHHYKLFITAMVSSGTIKEEQEDKESKPTYRLYSKNVGDSFSIFVRLPKDYNRHKHINYPVVYLLDANAYFDIAGNAMEDILKEQHKNADEPILIGIGYKDFIQNDTMRNRDYTYPVALASDSFSISGGADKFLQFIQTELVPFIDKTYHTDTTERSLMGHSLGGYFAMFALQQQLATNNSTVAHFAAASPSMHYYNYYLVKQFEQTPLPVSPSKPLTLFITMGEGENGEGGDTTNASAVFNSMLQKFSQKWAGIITVHGEIYHGLHHMETAAKTFEDALRAVMAEKRNP